MRITIVVVGSRGDVQPFVALGRKLQANGHEVILNAQRDFEDFIRQWGLGFYPMAGDPKIIMTMLGSDKFGVNHIRFLQALQRWFTEFMEDMMDDMEQACKNADMIISSFLGAPAIHIAQKYDIPAFIGSMFPVYTPTATYPSLSVSFRNLGSWGNILSHHFERLSPIIGYHSTMNRLLKKLDMPPLGYFEFPYDEVNGKLVHRLFAYSPSFLAPAPDYPEHVHVTGYWFLDAAETWTAPPALEAFIEAGEPPVYIGFGSMIDNHADEMSRIVTKALQLCGQRGLLLGGWGNMGHITLNENIFVVDAAPHDWLFPRMAAVVHHGGAGTTAAGLCAGKATVIVPFMGDQIFWGRQIETQRLGAAPIPASKITPERLADAIDFVVNNSAVRENAAKLGQHIQQEDGLTEAVRIIKSVVNANNS